MHKDQKIKYLERELQQYKQYEKIIKEIMQDIMNLPDGEVSPSVHSILLKHTLTEEANARN